MYAFLSEPGGIERVMKFQAQALQKAGHEVKLAFAYVDEKLKKEMFNDFEVMEYNKLPIKNETLQISTSILRTDYKKLKDSDLIICHTFPSSYNCYKLLKKFKIPYILHLHHPPKFLYDADLTWAKNDIKRKAAYFLVKNILRKPFQKLDNLAVKNAKTYFAASQSVAKKLKEVYDIKATVLYSTLNPEFKIKNFSKRDIAHFKIFDKFILFSGRVVQQKRIDWLIEAVSKLKDKKFQLVIAGIVADKLKQELQKQADKEKVNIVFLGNLEVYELLKLYNLAELTISICPNEGFGLSLVESIACGTPAISWNDGSGPTEIISEGKNGFLAKPYDIDDLVKKIEKALEKKWDKNVLVKSVEKFGEEKIAGKLLKNI